MSDLSDDLVCVLMALWWANEGGLEAAGEVLGAAFRDGSADRLYAPVMRLLELPWGTFRAWWWQSDTASRRAAIERAMRDAP